MPDKAHDEQHKVLVDKDIIIMGTDGLFDNVYDEDMEPCIKKEISFS